MICWKCGACLESPPNGKLPFRATCDTCLSWLHCCKNCTHYKLGRANDCLVPNTEPVSDRERCNFCEEFELLGKGPQVTAKPEDVGQSLFGDADRENTSKKDFKDLFQD